MTLAPSSMRCEGLCDPRLLIAGKNRSAADLDPSGAVEESSWVFLALVGWALGLLFALIVVRMSDDKDRVARRQQERIDRDATKD